MANKSLTKRLDKYFSLYIRSRGVCEAQGADGKACSIVLQCAHVIPRTNKNLRWDAKNALSMCMRHHLYWQHKNPLEFAEWFKKKYPKRHKYLMANKNNLLKLPDSDLEDLLAYLRKRLDKQKH